MRMSQTGSLKQQKFPSSPFWSSGSKARVPAALGFSQVSPWMLSIHGLVSARTPSASPCRFTGWSLHTHARRLPVESQAGFCTHTLGVSLQIHGLVSARTPSASPCWSSSVLLLRTPIRLNQGLPWRSHFNIMTLLNGLSTNTFTFCGPSGQGEIQFSPLQQLCVFRWKSLFKRYISIYYFNSLNILKLVVIMTKSNSIVPTLLGKIKSFNFIV